MFAPRRSAMPLVLVVMALFVVGCTSGSSADAPTSVPIAQESASAVEATDPPGSDGEEPNEELAASPRPTRVRQPVLQNDRTFASITDVDFENNFVYTAGFEDEVPALVTDGLFENGEWGDEDYLSLFVTDVVFGDLDSDGADEAVVTTSLNTGGTGRFDRVRSFRLVDGLVEEAGDVRFGDRADGGIYDIAIEDGLLKVWSFSTTQGACCPNEITQTQLLLGGHSLVAVDRGQTRTFVNLGDVNDELKFLPGTSSAVLARDASAIGTSVVSLEAGAGQLLTVVITDGPAPLDISITNTSTGQVMSVLADTVLPSDAIYDVVIVFDTAATERSTIELAIDGGEPEPAVSWTPAVFQQLVTQEPFVRTSLAWPMFAADQPGTDAANAALADYVVELDDFWIDDVTIVAPLDNSSYEVTYNVTLATDEIVSVDLNYFDYVCCRPYPNYGQHAVVLDLTAGRIIPVDEILDLSRIDEITAIWFAQGQAEEILPLEILGDQDVVRFDSLALVPGGVEFGTDRGSLGGGLPGTRTVVTFEQLGDIVNPALRSRLGPNAEAAE